MKLTSNSFNQGDPIPAVHSVEGKDVSPPLAWSGAPDATQSFALICDDPDAPSPKRPAPEPWVHWVIFNLPGTVSALPEGIGRSIEPSEVAGSCQGRNSWPSDNLGYRGPAPPPGSGTHRYFFKLYALDTMLPLEGDVTKQALLEAMSGHVLAETELMGTYER